LLDVPDAIEPVRGYRRFDVRSDVLYSMTRDVAWLPGTNAAGCDVVHGLAFDDCRFVHWFSEGPPLVLVDPGLAARMRQCVIEYDGFADTVELVLPQNGEIRGRHFIASALRVKLEPGSTPVAPAGHLVPDPDCSCGFYAVTNDSDLPRNRGIPAVVEGWGRVQMHRNGWRAQFARVTALVAEGWRDGRRLRRVADRYGAPILRREEAA